MAQGTQVGAIHYDLDLDDSKFKKGMGEARGHLDGLKDRFEAAEAGSKIFTAAIVAGAAAVVAFGAKSVAAYNAAIEAQTKLRTNLLNVKGAREEDVAMLQKQASELQKLGVIEDDTIIAGQAQLATFNLQASTIAKVTPKIADMAAQLGGYNVGAEQMVQLNNLVGKVLTGNIGALSRYGVTLSETQAEQLKAGDEAKKAAVLVEVLSQNYGKVNEALRKTPKGTLTGIKNDFGDFMELVGEGITKVIQPFIDRMADWVKAIGGPEGAFKLLNEKLQWFKDNGAIIAGFILGGMTPALFALASGVWAVMAPLIPFIAIGTALGFLVQALINHFGGLSGVMNALKPILETIGNIFNTFIKPVLDAVWDSIANRLWPALKQLWQTLEPILMPVLKAIGILLGGVLLGAIMAFVGAIWVAVNVINVIIRGLTWLIDQIKAVISWVWNINAAVFNAMRNVYDGLTRPFRDAFNWIKDQVGKVVNKLKDLNPFTRHSPSLVDMVKKGTTVIAREYGAMFDDISAMSRGFTPDVRFAATGPLGGTGALVPAPTSPSSPVNVTIQAGAFVGTPGEARAFAEMFKGELDKIDRQRG